MLSSQVNMREMCSRYVDNDFMDNVTFAHIFDDYFFAILVTNDQKVYVLTKCEWDKFGFGPVTEIPKLVHSLSGVRICQVAIGRDHILALSTCGVVYAWGRNEYDQLGGTDDNNAVLTNYSSEPIVVAGDLENRVVTQVECGGLFSVALTDEGKVFTWGINTDGRTGHGTDSHSTPSPKLVEGMLVDQVIVKISTHWASVLCLNSEGKVYGWGYSGSGSLAFFNSVESVPKAQLPVLANGIPARYRIKDISNGFNHTLALTDEGILLAWGYNSKGQIGNGTTEDVSVATRIELDSDFGETSDHTVARILAEGSASFAMNNKGSVYAWGSVDGQEVLRPTKYDITFPEPSKHSASTTSKSVISDLLKSFDNPATSDFVITVEGKDIHVNKTILQLRSPYFEIMLSSVWQETENDRVVVEHHSYVVYYEFLRYLYCGELRSGLRALSADENLQLMELASMALDDHLAKLCTQRIQKKLTVHNILKVISVAMVLDKKDLINYCVNWTVEQGFVDSLVESEASKELPAEQFQEFISKCSLKISLEQSLQAAAILEPEVPKPLRCFACRPLTPPSLPPSSRS